MILRRAAICAGTAAAAAAASRPRRPLAQGAAPDAAPPPASDDPTAALQRKIEQLKALLESSSLVQHAVQRQEEADSAKMVVILREQEESFAELLEATKVEVEARLLLRLREEMEAQAAAYAEELDAAADAQLRARHAQARAVAEAAEAEVNAKLRELEEALKSTREEAARAEADAHAARIAALAPEVAAFHSALSADVALKRTSHATHLLSAAVLSVEEALDGAGAAAALGARWRRLPALAATLDDALLAEVLAAPAPRASADEITLPALSARYDAVATSARVAALTPEHSGLWGHILGAVVARLTVSADGRETEGSAALARARAWLDRGALGPAVAEVRALRGGAAAACAGWLAAAEERLLLEQALAVSKAQATIALDALDDC